MIKKELIAMVAEKEQCSVQQASAILESTLAEIKKQVKNGEDVVIRGFGTFKMVTRKGRIAQNIRAGKPIEVPDRDVPVFRVSKHF